ncbi:MAG TPA: hypothetical protein VJV40_04085 [Thermodesulfobacteriota bacterium]|nr:hypothetical protein [Thermodesulfobacteriota bacterium]
MEILDQIPMLPLWAVFLGTFVVVVLSIFLGCKIGAHNRKRHGEGEEGPVGSVVGATLGLLAFMLAFTFGLTANRYDTRKEILLDEVNAIGTAFLRTDFLVEPYRTQIRGLFRDYVDMRTAWIKEPERLEELIAESEAIQDRIWTLSVEAVAKTPNQEITSSYIESLNEVIDLHTKRIIVALMYRIPTLIWYALIFVTVLAMGAVGYQFGITGGRSILISLLLALTFSAVIYLIADIDRSLGGAIRVSQKPMIELQKRINAAVPRR